MTRYQMALDTLKRIKATMQEVKEKYNVSSERLCDNGAIYYMNANDGTRFDWNANDRTCEFFTFWKSCELGFCKIMGRKDGNIEVYVFGESKYQSTENFEFFIGESETRALAELMYLAADCKGKYDKSIDNIDFNIKMRRVSALH